MRLDVRQQTELAAAWEKQVHDTYVALIDGPLVRETENWSEPVQLRMVPQDKTGIIEIEVRRPLDHAG